MSRQPEPPASIAETIARFVAWYPDEVARAVWDALLAEGRLDHERDSWDSTHDVLVIPLPVVEPRDTEQALRCEYGCTYVAHDDPACDDCGQPNPNAYRPHTEQA